MGGVLMNLSNKINKTITDPVCGMAVEPNIADITAKIDGETYFFCAESCRKSFMEDPQKYLCHEMPLIIKRNSGTYFSWAVGNLGVLCPDSPLSFGTYLYDAGDAF